MRNLLFIAIFSLFFVGCGETKPTISETPIEKNTIDASKENDLQPVASHSTDKENDAKALPNKTDVPKLEKSSKKTKWTRSGTPIDVTEFNTEINEADKELKTKPTDEVLKNNLSEAYTKRGVALTEARQYASAIGDYRKALKLNPENAEAKKWIATITSIYKSINREVPSEGEEPAPLEFEKKKTS